MTLEATCAGFMLLWSDRRLVGSTPQTMFAPKLHRMGKRQSRRLWIKTGGFAVTDRLPWISVPSSRLSSFAADQTDKRSNKYEEELEVPRGRPEQRPPAPRRRLPL